MRKNVLLLIDDERYKMVIDESAENLLSTFANYTRVGNAAQLSRKGYTQLFKDVEGVITTWGTPFISVEILDKAPRLKIISHAAGSIKPIVCKEALQRGITVTSAASFIAPSVAEMVLLFVLASLRELIHFDRLAREKHLCIDKYSKEGLFNQKVGLIGCGNVAREFIKLLQPFRVRILVFDPFLSRKDAEKLGVKLTSSEYILKNCKIISLHAALTSRTQGMIGKNELDMISPGAILVNTAHGGLINQKALMTKLKEGKFKAAIDVTDPEPPSPDDEIKETPNLMLTPHISGLTRDRIKLMGKFAVEDMKAFFEGSKPKNSVTIDRYDILA